MASRPGRSRPRDASTLRSLFGIVKSERLIFANPARRVHVAGRNPSVPVPLPAHQVTAIAEAAGRDPALRALVSAYGFACRGGYR